MYLHMSHNSDTQYHVWPVQIHKKGGGAHLVTVMNNYSLTVWSKQHSFMACTSLSA